MCSADTFLLLYFCSWRRCVVLCCFAFCLALHCVVFCCSCVRVFMHMCASAVMHAYVCTSACAWASCWNLYLHTRVVMFSIIMFNCLIGPASARARLHLVMLAFLVLGLLEIQTQVANTY